MDNDWERSDCLVQIAADILAMKNEVTGLLGWSLKVRWR